MLNEVQVYQDVQAVGFLTSGDNGSENGSIRNGPPTTKTECTPAARRTLMARKRKPKALWVGDTPVTPITAKERRKVGKRIEKRYERLRKKYPEIHGKVVDFITHSIEDHVLYFTIRFKDKTDFSFRYACEMFVVGADLCDVKSGDFEMIREYMRPILT